ncbi:MAG: glycosyltransferase family 9 protein [Acidobacteriota bacterium]
MKVSTMRRVDAWIGVPLCLLASSLLAVVSWLFKPAAAADKPRSVLIIKLSELGALITLGPALRSLAELVGRGNLYFMTFAESRELLQILDFVPRENTFILRTDALTHLVLDALGGLLRIRRRRIDCAVDLDFFSRATALIGLLSGCRRRVGCHAYFGEGPSRGDLLTHRVKFNPHIHVSQMFEVLAKAVEKSAGDFPRIEFVPNPVEAPRDRFQPTVEELASVQRTLLEVGTRPQDMLILLNTNISDREAIPLRKWSDERYVELAKLILAGIPSSFVLLTGSPREAETIARLEASVGDARCRSVAGKTTLRELLTLYSKSAMMVTNDSGPAHFATITDIEVVVLFGPETPLLWRPLGNRVRVIYRALACSPCFTVYNGRQSRCSRNACMDIAPGEVYATVQQRLADRLATGQD